MGDAKMLAMSPAERQQSLEWMRESELKHGRLAMLAAAGWPIAELYSRDWLLRDELTGGDYGFDPMGLAGKQKPDGAFPFDAFMGSKTPIDSVAEARRTMRLARDG